MSNWFSRTINHISNVDVDSRQQKAQWEYDNSIDRRGHMHFGTRRNQNYSRPQQKENSYHRSPERRDAATFARHESLNRNFREESRKRESVQMLLATDKRRDRYIGADHQEVAKSRRNHYLPKAFEGASQSCRDFQRRRKRRPLAELMHSDASIEEILVSLKSADRSDVDAAFVQCIEENLWKTALNLCEAHRLGAIVLPSEFVAATLATVLQCERHTDAVQFFLKFNVRWYKLPIEIYTNLFEICSLDSVAESSSKNGGEWLLIREGSHLFPFPTAASATNFVVVLLKSMQRHEVPLTSDPSLASAALKCLSLRDWDSAWDLYKQISRGEMGVGEESGRRAARRDLDSQRSLSPLSLLQGGTQRNKKRKSSVPLDLDDPGVSERVTTTPEQRLQDSILAPNYRYLLPAAFSAAASSGGDKRDNTAAGSSRSPPELRILQSESITTGAAATIYEDMKECAPREVIPALMATLALDPVVTNRKTLAAINMARKLALEYIKEKQQPPEGDAAPSKKKKRIDSILNVSSNLRDDASWQLALNLFQIEADQMRTDGESAPSLLDTDDVTEDDGPRDMSDPLLPSIPSAGPSHQAESIESLSTILLRDGPSVSLNSSVTEHSLAEKAMGVVLMQQFGTATQQSRVPHLRSSVPAQTALKIAQTLHKEKAGRLATQFGHQLLRTKNFPAVPLLAATAAVSGQWKDASELCSKLFALRGIGLKEEDSPTLHEYSLVINSCLKSDQWQNALFWIDRAHNQGHNLNLASEEGTSFSSETEGLKLLGSRKQIGGARGVEGLPALSTLGKLFRSLGSDQKLKQGVV